VTKAVTSHVIWPWASLPCVFIQGEDMPEPRPPIPPQSDP
jgi:hypothetical protein